MCTEPSDDIFRNGVPIDASRLSMPLHHQPVECRHQDAGLDFHPDIRPKLTRRDASTQQLAQG